jgi:hypothetical protein
MHDVIDWARFIHSLHVSNIHQLDNSSFEPQNFQVDELETSESGNNSLFGWGQVQETWWSSLSTGTVKTVYSGVQISNQE